MTAATSPTRAWACGPVSSRVRCSARASSLTAVPGVFEVRNGLAGAGRVALKTSGFAAMTARRTQLMANDLLDPGASRDVLIHESVEVRRTLDDLDLPA